MTRRREGERQAERGGSDDGLRCASDRDPDRERILDRAGPHRCVLERWPVAARPRHAGGVADLDQQLELLGEELVVVVEVVAKSGKDSMKEPRPAMISARPPDSRSTWAKSWKTRTGSSELRTETALDNRMRLVRTATAARTVAGEETRKSGRWCSPIAKRSRPSWSPSSASSRRLRMRCSGLRSPMSANVASPSSMRRG